MIRMEGLSKGFGATRALDGVTLDVAAGSFVALLGPSGSGKTTLLRVVAGLEQADAGALWMDGRPALGLPPGRRGVGMVFQGYALFGHMTVADNIGFGLRVRGRDRGTVRATVERLLAMVHLEGLGARLPAQLSGGQRQRVALARALAVEPRILLLDEPFGALDRQVREELRGGLRRLQRELGITALFVTHDQEEALALADRVVILNRGAVVADLTAGDLVGGAVRGFAARFLSLGEGE
jgi:sulfate transport system ATP-binding protein